LPTFWADKVAYASANNDSPSPPTADVSDESLPIRSDHPATSLRNPEHVDQPSEQGSTDHPAIPETSLRSPGHVEQPSEQGSTAEGDNSLSPPENESIIYSLSSCSRPSGVRGNGRQTWEFGIPRRFIPPWSRDKATRTRNFTCSGVSHDHIEQITLIAKFTNPQYCCNLWLGRPP